MQVKSLLLLIVFLAMVGCDSDVDTAYEDVNGFTLISQGAKLAKSRPVHLSLRSEKRPWFVRSGSSYIEKLMVNYPSEQDVVGSVGRVQGSVFMNFLSGLEPANMGRCDASTATKRGSGRPQTSSPSLIEFERIEVDGPINVIGEYSAYPEVVVYGDDNLLPFIEAESREGVLRISAPSGSICYGVQPAVYFRGPQFRSVSITGSATVELHDVFSRRLDIDVGIRSRLVAFGHVNLGAVALGAYASADLSSLIMDNATVELEAQSDAQLRVTKSIVGSVEQSGTLHLEENIVSEEIAGDGRIEYFSVSTQDDSTESHTPGLN